MAADSMLPTSPTPSIEHLLKERDWLFQLSASLVGPADADDLAQDAWLALLERQRRDGAGAEGRGWLAGAAHRLALAKHRKVASRLGHEAMYAQEAARAGCSNAPTGVDGLAEQAALQREVIALVLAMDEPLRGTLLLRYQAGLTPAEIAKSTGTPAGTVRRRIKDGLDRLRARMDADHGERSAWAPALVGVLPETLRVSLLSSGSGLAAGAAFVTMKKLMWLAALVLVVGAGWMARRGVGLATDAEPVAPVESDDGVAELQAKTAALAMPRLPDRQSLDVPMGTTAQAAEVRASYSVVDEDGEPVSVTSMIAVVDDERKDLAKASDGSFALDEAEAGPTDAREFIPLIVSRSGSWPQTFDAPVSGGQHVFVWPKGITLRGQALEHGSSPGEAVRFTLKRDIGWSGRPYAAKIDRRLDPIPKELTTDEDGRFVLVDLPQGWRGWLKIESAWRFEGGSRQSALVNADGPRDIGLSIERSPRIVGRLVDSETDSAVTTQNFHVFASDPGGSTAIHEPKTDGEGRFVWFPDAQTTEIDLHLGVDDGFRKRVLEGIKAPREGTLDLGDLPLERTALARLRVVDPDGQPVAGAQVKERGAQRAIESAGDGKLNVPVGTLERADLEVRAEGFEHALYSELSLSTETETTIQLRPELRFSLLVLGPEGTPIPNCQLSFVPHDLRPDGLGIFNTRGRDLTTGTVTSIAFLPGDRCRLSFSTDDEGRIEVGGLSRDSSIEFGFMEESEWLETPRLITAGVDGRWEATIYDRRERFPEVVGIVTTADGAPVSGANVKFPSSLLASYRTTDENGAFSAPVEWKDGRSHVMVTAPGFAKRRELLELASLGSDPLRLTLEKERPLTVSLVDPNGTPIVRTRLFVSTRSRDGSWATLHSEASDSDGICRFNGLGPGELRFTLHYNDVSYRALVLDDVVDYRFQLPQPVTVTADWSALIEDGIEPSYVILRRQAPARAASTRPFHEDNVGWIEIPAEGFRPSRTSFLCEPGRYELLAYSGRVEEAAKVFETIRFHARPDVETLIELGRNH